MIYPTTLSSALRTSPNLSSPLYRRWFPGAGQRGGGFAGMGFCDPSDPTCGVTDTTDLNITSSSPTEGIDPSGSLYSQLIAQGVDPADAVAYDPLGACAVDPNCSMPIPGTPNIIPAGTPGGQMTAGTTTATPAQIAALAKLASTPGLALTAAQIAAGVSAGTVAKVPTTQCQSGYKSSATGVCVANAGQWFSFATNAQVMTYGAVIIAALVIVPMLSGGGGRRRR